LNFIPSSSQSSTNLEIVTIAGNRPEIIKLSELVKYLGGTYKNAFVYTGQHFSPNMRDIFFDELNVKIDYDLGSNTSDVQLLRENIRMLLKQTRPSYVIVYGDTGSTLAGALAAKDVNCKLFHIEAGLRCFDLSKPEERIRIQVDSLSDYYLPPTELSKLFLKYENVPEERIFVTGNLIVDVCRKFYRMIQNNKKNQNLPPEYILMTLHRPALVDNPNMLMILSKFLAKINYKIIFPVHPRTKNSLEKYGIKLPENVIMMDALGYSEFLSLLKDSLIVLTDSGGVQEEAIILKRPCITLNNTTERQETILLKANRLFHPLDGEDQDRSINDVIQDMLHTEITINPYGENVTSKAFDTISKIIDNDNQKIYAE
jgi:UDP-N-acetylglucosamine 2-epimerase (non-hydrolysing)